MGSVSNPPPQPMSRKRSPRRAAFQRVAAHPGADLFLDELQPHRIEHMQHPELAFRVPPFGGHFREFLDFGGVERGGKGGHDLTSRFLLWHYCISEACHL
jgi:hypothetical protein